MPPLSASDPIWRPAAEASRKSKPHGSVCLTSRKGVITPEDHNGTNNCNNHAIEIEAGYSRRAKSTKDQSSNDRADNAKRDVEQQALALLVDDFTPDKTRNEAKYDPTDDGHKYPPTQRLLAVSLQRLRPAPLTSVQAASATDHSA